MTQIAQASAWERGDIELPYWERERIPAEQLVHEEQQERIALWRSGVLKAFGGQDVSI